MPAPFGRDDETNAMHYPHKSSNVRRTRRLGFRTRMKTRKGRQIINRKRRLGRRISPEM